MIDPDNVRKANCSVVNVIDELENAVQFFARPEDLRRAAESALEELRGVHATLHDELEYADTPPGDRPHDRGRGLTQSAVQDAFESVSGLECDDCPCPNHCAMRGCVDDSSPTAEERENYGDEEEGTP